MNVAESLHGQGDPAGSWADQRRLMVERDLRRRGIRDERVLAAMGSVPREVYVPARERAASYEDRALPIAAGQTISQPYTVAFMCEALQLQGSERVLEIGTGSGYAAAVLGLLAADVVSIERLPELAAGAAERLREQAVGNVAVHCADGTLGWLPGAPFDGILVSAGGKELPRPLVEQLAVGGRLVIPLDDAAGGQRMWRLTREPDRLRREDLGRFSFVPLIGSYGWG